MPNTFDAERGVEVSGRYGPRDALASAGWLTLAGFVLAMWFVLLTSIHVSIFGGLMPQWLRDVCSAFALGFGLALPVWFTSRLERLQWAIAVSLCAVGVGALLLTAAQVVWVAFPSVPLPLNDPDAPSLRPDGLAMMLGMAVLLVPYFLGHRSPSETSIEPMPEDVSTV